MLTAPLEQLWNEYLRAEQDRIRAVMMPALDRFIDRLLQLPPAAWHQWAKEIAASISDRSADIPVRMPLFRRVLVPALVEGVLRREPGCARWLACFEDLLPKSNGSELPSELRSVDGLLNEAVRVDPDDELARKRLIDHQAWYLEYTIHELPSGILYDSSFATAAQCDELLDFLNHFKAHVSHTRQDAKFSDLIVDCELHYHAYADYVRAGGKPGGYEEFFRRRQVV